MLKYVNTEITFSEIPDEITLCINISNCPNKCKGCHSAYLSGDIGEPLYRDLSDLIRANKGISCVSFMGGDSEPEQINTFAKYIKETYPKIKVAWYSGKSEISKKVDLINFDFIKVGPYIQDKGPLNCKTTNQVMFFVDHNNDNILKDITYKFWKNETDN